jgi:hypothetical protein
MARDKARTTLGRTQSGAFDPKERKDAPADIHKIVRPVAQRAHVRGNQLRQQLSTIFQYGLAQDYSLNFSLHLPPSLAALLLPPICAGNQE